MFLQHQKDRLLLLELGWKLVSMWELNHWLNYTLRAQWQRRVRVAFLKTALTWDIFTISAFSSSCVCKKWSWVPQSMITSQLSYRCWLVQCSETGVLLQNRHYLHKKVKDFHLVLEVKLWPVILLLLSNRCLYLLYH